MTLWNDDYELRFVGNLHNYPPRLRLGRWNPGYQQSFVGNNLNNFLRVTSVINEEVASNKMTKQFRWTTPPNPHWGSASPPWLPLGLGYSVLVL